MSESLGETNNSINSKKSTSPLDKIIEVSKQFNQKVSEKLKEIKEKTLSATSSKETDNDSVKLSAELEAKEKEELEAKEQEEEEAAALEAAALEAKEQEAKEAAEQEAKEAAEQEAKEKEAKEAAALEAKEQEEQEQEAAALEEELDFDLDSEESIKEKIGSVSKMAEKVIKPIAIFIQIKYFLIFTILLFLFLNIFAYVGQGQDYFSSIVDNFFMKFLYKQNDHVRSLLGLPKIIEDEDDEEEEESPNKIEKSTVPKSQSNLGKAIEKERAENEVLMDKKENNLLMKKLNSFKGDDSMESTIQSSLKSGWCYVGKDRGFRSCVRVRDSDTCISGDIFPSKEICINPTLRE